MVHGKLAKPGPSLFFTLEEQGQLLERILEFQEQTLRKKGKSSSHSEPLSLCYGSASSLCTPLEVSAALKAVIVAGGQGLWMLRSQIQIPPVLSVSPVLSGLRKYLCLRICTGHRFRNCRTVFFFFFLQKQKVISHVNRSHLVAGL